MKYKTRFLSLLASCGVTLANANSVTIMNHSADNKPLEITYRTAYQEAMDPKVHYSEPTTITVKDKYTANIDNCTDAQRCGIVIDTIDGHELPETVRAFNQANTCSMATNTFTPTGSLILVETVDNDGHGNIRCEPQGGLNAENH